jgi:hypothetical protein
LHCPVLRRRWGCRSFRIGRARLSSVDHATVRLVSLDRSVNCSPFLYFDGAQQVVDQCDVFGSLREIFRCTVQRHYSVPDHNLFSALQQELHFPGNPIVQRDFF